MNRRSFCTTTSGAALGFALPGFAQDARRRVAVIGSTGRGNFGHGLDTVWLHIPETGIVGIADGDQAGLARELEKLKLGSELGYTDYAEMLAEVRPEFVTVSPRHADQHRDMVLAAIEAGTKGIYVEKPFVRTPGEADQLVAACEKHGARIAVAHRNRYHPVLQIIDALIADGEIGKLLEIRGRGKGDRRGGGEDLWVLGTHVMNLMAYFGGAPKSCSAVMLQNGRRVTKADVGEGAEGLGPLAGNEVHARYEMADGITAYFDSIADDGTKGAGFGLQLVGSEGVINIRCDRDPLAHLIPGSPFKSGGIARPWVPITTAGVGKTETRPEIVASVRNHVLGVRDLIDACDVGREPLCSAGDGLVTVEMCCAVFESHRQGGRAVSFPLRERGNALLLL
ncbi:MAG: Gfo/Idh/MocA family protein [Verrucomicrobiales bacterium]